MRESSIELLIRYNTLYGRCIGISNERNKLLRVLNKMVDGPWYSWGDWGDGYVAVCNYCARYAASPDLIVHEDDCHWLQGRNLVDELTASKEGFL